MRQSNYDDRGASILIVDDNHENLKVLGNILKDNYYNVSFTDNGAKALEIAGKLLPDLILLDVSMPGISGLETCLKLKEQELTRQIPVVFLTARTEIDDIIKGFETGAVDYVTKPFNSKELLTRVKTQIELKRNQDLLRNEIQERTRIQEELEKANEKLFKLSNLDGLTRIPNRRRFDEYLTNELKRHQRNFSSLSLIMCDVDSFKLYNDEYGHVKGDECLIKLARAMQECLKRPSDLAARYGGEEFSIILPNTDVNGSIKIAEEIRKKIIKLDIDHEKSEVAKVVTISLGISTIENNSSITDKEFLDLADKALYRAKRSGKNIGFHSSK